MTKSNERDRESPKDPRKKDVDFDKPWHYRPTKNMSIAQDKKKNVKAYEYDKKRGEMRVHGVDTSHIPANAAHEKELKEASMRTIMDELLEKAKGTVHVTQLGGQNTGGASMVSWREGRKQSDKKLRAYRYNPEEQVVSVRGSGGPKDIPATSEKEEELKEASMRTIMDELLNKAKTYPKVEGYLRDLDKRRIDEGEDVPVTPREKAVRQADENAAKRLEAQGKAQRPEPIRDMERMAAAEYRFEQNNPTDTTLPEAITSELDRDTMMSRKSFDDRTAEYFVKCHSHVLFGETEDGLKDKKKQAPKADGHVLGADPKDKRGSEYEMVQVKEPEAYKSEETDLEKGKFADPEKEYSRAGYEKKFPSHVREGSGASEEEHEAYRPNRVKNISDAARGFKQHQMKVSKEAREYNDKDEGYEVYSKKTPIDQHTQDLKEDKQIDASIKRHEKKNKSMIEIMDELLEKAVYGVGAVGGKYKPQGSHKDTPSHSKGRSVSLSPERQKELLEATRKKALTQAQMGGLHKKAAELKSEKSLDERTSDLAKSLYDIVNRRHFRGDKADPDAGIAKKKEKKMDEEAAKREKGDKAFTRWTAEDKTQKSRSRDNDDEFHIRNEDPEYRRGPGMTRKEDDQETEARKQYKAGAKHFVPDPKIYPGYEKSLDERTIDLVKALTSDREKEIHSAVSKVRMIKHGVEGAEKVTAKPEDVVRAARTHNAIAAKRTQKSICDKWQDSPFVTKGARVMPVGPGGQVQDLSKDDSEDEGAE